MSDAACMERKRSATPAAHIVVARFTIAASVRADEVDPVASHLHAGRERYRGEDDPDEDRASERRKRIAHDDRRPVGGRQHHPPAEAGLEVARDAEPGEDAAERRRRLCGPCQGLDGRSR